jgi:hypothetical protein
LQAVAIVNDIVPLSEARVTGNLRVEDPLQSLQCAADEYARASCVFGTVSTTRARSKQPC